MTSAKSYGAVLTAAALAALHGCRSSEQSAASETRADVGGPVGPASDTGDAAATSAADARAQREAQAGTGPHPPTQWPEWRWERVAVAPGPAPTTRRSATAELDEWHDRLVVFGGYERRAPNEAWIHADTWALELGDTPPRWRLLVPGGLPGGPRPRESHCSVLDRETQAVWVFGGSFTLKAHDWAGGQYYDGSDDEGYDEVWMLPLAGDVRPAWVQVMPEGPRPFPRYAPGCAFVPGLRWLVVFGGESYTRGSLNDTWILDLGPEGPRWRDVDTGTPPPLLERTCATLGPLSPDPGNLRFVTHGGFRMGTPNKPTGHFVDVWTLGLATTPSGAIQGTWRERARASDLPSGPCAPIFYDIPSQSVLELAAHRWLAGQSYFRGDVWRFSESDRLGWSRVRTTRTVPTARASGAAAWDAKRDRFLWFGGNLPDPATTNEVWALVRMPPAPGDAAGN